MSKLHPDENSDDALEQLQLLSSENSHRLNEYSVQKREAAQRARQRLIQLGGMSAVVSLVFG
ncbi:MAG: hypothetical protein SGPRY_005307 [Prymnesium sp.]